VSRAHTAQEKEKYEGYKIRFSLLSTVELGLVCSYLLSPCFLTTAPLPFSPGVSHGNKSGMLITRVNGVNHRFWSHLGVQDEMSLFVAFMQSLELNSKRN